MQTDKVSTARKRFRSVKYRSLSSDIKPQKTELGSTTANKNPAEYLKKSLQFVKNKRRSIFASEHDFNLSMNLRKQARQQCPKHKSMNNIKLNRSSISAVANPQTLNLAKQFGKDTLMESFQNLMALQSPARKLNSKLGLQQLNKVSRLKEVQKHDRITLPNIIQYADSGFTALDPINLPIQSIETGIATLKAELKQLPQPLRIMRQQMKIFEKHYLQGIQNHKESALSSIKKIRKKISQNIVFEQQRLLKAKRQVKDLQNFILPFEQQFNKTHERLIVIQTDIFHTQPFQLAENKLEEEEADAEVEQQQQQEDFNADKNIVNGHMCYNSFYTKNNSGIQPIDNEKAQFAKNFTSSSHSYRRLLHKQPPQSEQTARRKGCLQKQTQDALYF